jgi:protein SCO1/2
MNKALAALFCAGLLLAGCERAATPPPLAGARIGGPFVLTDQDGHRYSSDALKGRYAVVYFGYTFCPDVCPLDMAILGKGLKKYEAQDPARAAKVQPVFITVDPERDTPAVLKQYVAAFHPRLIGLTGSAQAIAKVEKAYAAIGQKQPAEKGASGYLVQHSRMATLFGPDGQPISLVPVDADDGQVADTLAKWVK